MSFLDSYQKYAIDFANNPFIIIYGAWHKNSNKVYLLIEVLSSNLLNLISYYNKALGDQELPKKNKKQQISNNASRHESQKQKTNEIKVGRSQTIYVWMYASPPLGPRAQRQGHL